MRAAVVGVVAGLCLSLAGCGKRPLDLDDGERGNLQRIPRPDPEGDEGERGDSSESGSIESARLPSPERTEPPPDEQEPAEPQPDRKTDPPDRDAPPPDGPRVPLTACFEFGEGNPDSIGNVQWQRQVRKCPSSACVDFFTLDRGCAIFFQRDNQRRTAELDGESCAAVRSVVSTRRFFDGLERCGALGKGDQVIESFEIEGRPGIARKLSLCNDEAVEAARMCIRAVVHGAFPDITF